MLNCKLHCQGSNISLAGMMDTWADVMVISSNNWPSQWKLQLVEGVTGVITTVIYICPEKQDYCLD